jgi:hypothetical protein
MVTFHNMGRCGNFLFQAATTLGYAIQHGIVFTVPATTIDSYWNPVYFPHLVNPFYDRDLEKIVIEENGHAFQSIPFTPRMSVKCNIVLKGYWQSYRYFDFCRERILEAFKIPYIFEPNLVALHVRRGDYLRYHQINPLATREYYEKAVREMWLRGYKKFLIFSDDLPWCKTEFQDPVYKDCEFLFNTGQDVLGDLSLMSGCAHTIISNSTFSWWGAWLNQNPDKTVICPHEDNYYGPANKHLDVSTLYPPEWIRIAYKPPYRNV